MKSFNKLNFGAFFSASFLSLLAVCVYIFSASTTPLTTSIQTPQQYTQESQTSANLYWETQAAYLYKNNDFYVNLRLDTLGNQINRVDAVITYDKDYLTLKDVNYNNFLTLNENTIDNNGGRFTFKGSLNDFNGNERLATLKFTPLKEGEQYVNFYCSPDYTKDDTNIWKKDNGDIINCYNLIAGHYQILANRCDPPLVPQNVKAVAGPKSDQITLAWDKVSNADYYNIAYGPSSLNYLWGAPNVGNTNTYAVGGLNPGSPYYFIVAAVNGCGSSGALQEVAAYAGSPSNPTYIQPPAPEVVEYNEVIASPSALATVSAFPSIQPSPSLIPVKPLPSLIPLNPPFSLPKIKLPAWLIYIGLGLILLLILSAVGKKLIKEEDNKQIQVQPQEQEVPPWQVPEQTMSQPIPTVNNPTDQPQVPIESPQEENKK